MNCPKCKEPNVFVETISHSKIFSIKDLTEEKLVEKIQSGDYEADDWCNSNVVVICDNCGEIIY